jgi:hypothetical protein
MIDQELPMSKFFASFSVLAAFAVSAQDASAASATGYVIDVVHYNSTAYSNACKFVVGTKATSTSGTTYYVKDSSTGYSSTCSAAMLAMYHDKSVTIRYTSSGVRYADGLTSTGGSGPVDVYYAQNSAPAGSLADKCMIEEVTSSGTKDVYVDDVGAEEVTVCITLAMLHFLGSSSSYYSISTTSSELMYLSVDF